MGSTRVKTPSAFGGAGFFPSTVLNYPIESPNAWTMIASIRCLSLFFLLKPSKRKEMFQAFLGFPADLTISGAFALGVYLYSHSSSNQPGFALKIAI